MMKNIKILLILLVQVHCTGQKQILPKDTTNMTQEIKKFDITTFKKNKVGTIYSFYNSDGDLITQDESQDFFSEKINKKNSKHSLTRSYYKSGNLRGKGTLYDNFFIGDLISYNENGEVVEVRNFDKHYTFTLEDVLHYLEENNIKETKKSPTGHKITINLWRTDSSNLSADDPIVWEISYGLVPYIHEGTDKTFMSFIKITLDGKTGEELKKEYKRARVDQEWLLIQK